MKNPHGVEPTRYMRRKENNNFIRCNPFEDPRIGNDLYLDIHINNECNKEDSCYIHNNGTREFECHPNYKSSLFVNTAGPMILNIFSVLDFEVYCKSNICSCCICF